MKTGILCVAAILGPSGAIGSPHFPETSSETATAIGRALTCHSLTERRPSPAKAHQNHPCGDAHVLGLTYTSAGTLSAALYQILQRSTGDRCSEMAPVISGAVQAWAKDRQIGLPLVKTKKLSETTSCSRWAGTEVSVEICCSALFPLEATSGPLAITVTLARPDWYGFKLK